MIFSLSFLNKPSSEQPLFLKKIREILCNLLEPFLEYLNIKFFNIFIWPIGHLCLEPDSFIKELILNKNYTKKPRFIIISAPYNRVANYHLLNYWKKYFFIISSPLLCFFLYPLLTKHKVSIPGTDYLNSKQKYINTEYKWGRRGPLLNLSKRDTEYGFSQLKRIGITQRDWFVCLHCRTSSYSWKGMPQKTKFQPLRNANIADYFPTIQDITTKGGWVIRMGDPGMEPLPNMYNVFDYAHSNLKNERMDVFLSATCRFFIGTNSGLYSLSTIFGVPVVIANGQLTVLPAGYNTLYIPKLVYSDSENKYVSFKETYNSTSIRNGNYEQFKKLDLKIIDNSPEEIREVVSEYWDGLQNKTESLPNDAALQKKFKQQIGVPEDYPIRIGKLFLKRYDYLL